MSDAQKKYLDNAATMEMLVEAGIDLMRQNLRRRQPAATEAQIGILLNRWLFRAGDEIPGDTAGQVRIRTRAV